MQGRSSRTPLMSRSWRSTGAMRARASASARVMGISSGSGEPALAALVALDVAIALALGAAGRAAGAEIELAHVLVLAQHRRRAVHDDPAALEDVAVVGVTQRHAGVLLGEQEGDAF